MFYDAPPPSFQGLISEYLLLGGRYSVPRHPRKRLVRKRVIIAITRRVVSSIKNIARFEEEAIASDFYHM